MTDEITLDAPETRLERFLAAAAGVEGITLDEPETRIERYLYKIAQGSGGVPTVEDADKGKYLHANESTGDLEWETAGGSGGGVLVVTDTDGTLNKTWQEIVDADLAVVHIEINSEEDPPPRGSVCPVIYHEIDTKMGDYSIGVLFLEDSSLFVQNYVASSASGYPER